MDSIDYYNRYAIPYFNETVDLDMSDILDKFIEYLPENAEVLDLGCGSGRDTVYLDEEGFAVTAMDGSSKMCELASIHTDKDVLHLTIDEMEFDDVFDGIWACAVLGHIEPEEVEFAMKKILRALKDDGILYFSVRKGDRNGIYNGRYYCDYSRSEIEELLDRFDTVEVIRIWKTEDVRTGNSEDQWYNVLLRKKDR